jgi:hypothetical protein
MRYDLFEAIKYPSWMHRKHQIRLRTSQSMRASKWKDIRGAAPMRCNCRDCAVPIADARSTIILFASLELVSTPIPMFAVCGDRKPTQMNEHKLKLYR